MQTQIESYNLSPQQKKVWQYGTGKNKNIYLHSVVSIEGELDKNKLSESFEKIVSAHEIFQIDLENVAGIKFPVQVLNGKRAFAWSESEAEIKADGDISLEIEKLKSEFFESCERDANHYAVATNLMTLTPRKHALLLSLSAVCGDVWTMKNLIEDIFSEYENESSGEDDEPIPYFNFNDWQTEILDEESAESAQRYWTEKSSGASRNPVLPNEKNKAFDDAQNFIQTEFGLSEAVFGELREIGEKNGISFEEWLFACWSLLVLRLSKRTPLKISKLVVGRKYDELRQTFGLIDGYVPVLIAPASSEEFDSLDFLSYVSFLRSEIEETQNWLEYYAGINEKLQAKSKEKTLPIGFEYVDLYERRGGEFNVSQTELSFDLEPLKLRLHCSRIGSNINFRLIGADSVYSDEQLIVLAERFETILKSTLANPHKSLNLLPIIGNNEKTRLIDQWNQTDHLTEGNIVGSFERQASETPDAIAVSDASESLTYRELNERANRLANVLTDNGIGRESLVGLYLERNISLAIAVLGVLKAGGGYVPLDPAYPAERLAYMATDAKVETIVRNCDWQDEKAKPENLTHEIDLRESVNWSNESVENIETKIEGEQLAYVIYTSGSTGKPKGVGVQHSALINYVSWAIERYEVSDGNGSLVHSSLGFDLTVTGLILPLLCGKEVRIIRSEPGIDELAETFSNSKNLSLIKLTPAHLNVLSQLLKDEDLKETVRYFVIGGEALFYEQLSFWQKSVPGIRLINEYGPTETVVGCVVHEAGISENFAGAVPIGKPINNTKVYVLDDNLNLAPIGVSGELYIGGKGVTRGYLGEPELTAASFLPDPFGANGERMYKTGDVVRYGNDGTLEYLGRNDNQVKIKGHRIELGEIEAAVKKEKEITECVVLVKKDSGDSEGKLVGYIETLADFDVSKLKKNLESYLPSYMIPQSFAVVESMPLTENGKIDRKKLLQIDAKPQENSAEYFAPRNSAEEDLTTIWSSVLGIEKVGIYDNFFDLGGDSIRSVRVVALAKEKGLNFTVQKLFGDQTIAKLSESLDALNQTMGKIERTAPFSLISEKDRAKLGADIEDAYPLAMIQTAMLYHMELMPDSPAYLNVNSWHLKAPFNEEYLKKSFGAVVDRHKVFRTSFDLTGFSQPLQLVHSNVEADLTVEDLRHLSGAEQEKYLGDFYEIERKSMFDLSLPTQMRFYIHRRTNETFQFSFTENHAIIDGWSTTSSLSEVFENYLALIDGQMMPVEDDISIEYRDFIKFEQATLANQATKDYWAKILEDATPATLPKCTKPDPLPNGKRVDYLNLTIDEKLLKRLRQTAQSLNVPLKTLLFSAHIKAMSMMTGLTDFTTGITTNNRPEEADGTRVRGNFLNTVPFRASLKAGSWAEMIRQVFEAEWEMLSHRRYPLGAMQRESGQGNLIETAFAYLHFHSVEGILKPGRIEILEDGAVDLSETNFPLQTVFIVSPIYEDSLAWLQIQLDTQQTSLETRENILNCYKRTLEAIAENPHNNHADLPNLEEKDSRKIIFDWNDTVKESGRFETVIDLFKKQAAQTPQSAAIKFGEKIVTYNELEDESNKLADYLQNRGIRREKKVAVLMKRSPDLLVSILAILKTGGAYLPIDPNNPAERIAYILSDSESEFLIVDEKSGENPIAVNAEILDFKEMKRSLKTEIPASIRANIEKDNLAYVIYTSGSTGKPKGTLITHEGLTNYLSWCLRDYETEKGNGAPLHSSVSFDLSVTSMFFPLLTGKYIDILADNVGIEALIAAIDDQPDYSFVKLTPTQLELMDGILPVEKIASVASSLIIGGENLKAETLETWRKHSPEIQIINEYGPTETVVGCCTFRVSADDASGENVPIGKPIDNTSMFILDSFMHPVLIGSIGEIYIGGKGVARGYLGRPEMTAEKFVPNPFSPENAGRRLYRTGDLARYREDGVIEFLGRKDNQIKIRGFRVEIGEIESVIGTHPAVASAFVIDYTDHHSTKQLAAYLVSNEEINGQEMREWLRAKLPDYMIPNKFIALDKFPLAVSGKIDPKALPQPQDVSNGGDETAKVLPRNEIENAIFQVWKDVLKPENLGVRDNFFDLGGDSFRLYEVHAKLKEKLEMPFTILDIFQYPTIDTFAAYLSKQNEETDFDEVRQRAARRKGAARRRGLEAGN